MKVQVAKWGNSTAVRLPKAVVRELGLTQGMTLDVSIVDGAVKLAPEEAVAPNPMPRPVTLDWIVAEVERLGGLENAPDDEWDWGPDAGSEVIHDDYNPRQKAP